MQHANRATHFLDSVQLQAGPTEAAPSGEVPQLKWIHVASEGTYRGHHQGAFDLTPQVLEQMVKNFRSDPRFKAEGDPKAATNSADPHRLQGSQPVLQFDYEHASEMFPGEGSIPTNGAPAPAWVLDVEIRKSSDGRTQLWALAQLGEQIRGQIGRNEYRFVSIAFNPEGVHWETGETIGTVLTSIAFTNQPFLRDLEPLAASARGSQPSGSRLQPGSKSSEAHVDPKSGDRDMPADDELRKRLSKALGSKHLLQDEALEEGIEQAAASSGQLNAILEALGVGDATAALQQIPEIMAARTELAAVMGQLDELLAMGAASDAAVAQQDVGAAMSAKALKGDHVKASVLARRTELVDAEAKKLGDKATAKEKVEARQKGRDAFLKEWGVETDPEKAHLDKPLVAGPGGAQFSVPKTPEALKPDQLDEGDPETIDLSQVPGVNGTERMINFLSSKDDAFKRLPWGEKIKRAGLKRRESKVVGLPEAS